MEQRKTELRIRKVNSSLILPLLVLALICLLRPLWTFSSSTLKMNGLYMCMHIAYDFRNGTLFVKKILIDKTSSVEWSSSG
jgi:hypothetical protein